MRAIFSHIGGKNGSLGAELAALLPSQKPEIYIEPFGGSFGLGIQSGYNPDDVNMVHNELDNITHAIFKAVTYDPEETLDAVFTLLDKYEYTQETVDYFRLLLDYEEAMGVNLFKNDFALGAAAWILKTITFNGNCMDLKNFEEVDPKTRVIKIFENRAETASMLKGVRTLKMDALEVLKYVKDSNRKYGKETFIYIDAPYSHSGKRKTKRNLYRVDIDKDDKKIEELAKILAEMNECTDCKIMASEYDNPIYNTILTEERGWEKVKVCDRYKSLSNPDSHGCKPMETEYIWRNYNEYGKLSPHNLETTNERMEEPMKSKTVASEKGRSKYKVEVSFLGTADDQQVEEEITTILKGHFLAKITSCIQESTALDLNSGNEKH